MIRIAWFFAFLCFAVAATQSLADTMTLKDGTVLHGRVINNGNSYWVKFDDGTSKTVPADNVANVVSDQSTSSASPTGAISTARTRANNADSALAAVAIWREFIDKNPGSADLAAAKDELAHWKLLADSGAEKINGKWIGGDERKKIIDQADALAQEADSLAMQNQTLKAIDKLREAVKIYPNSFRNNFIMGWLSMLSANYDGAITYYTAASKLHSSSVETLNNLAVAQFMLKQYVPALLTFEKAAEIQDNKVLAANMVAAFAHSPPKTEKDADLAKVLATAHLLQMKYALAGAAPAQLVSLPLPKGTAKSSSATPAFNWGGTGFFVRDDGLILTNRHVVKNAKTLLVLIGAEQTTADVVKIDDEQDLALIQVHLKNKVPFIKLAKADHPNDGADVVVMGYPMMDRLGMDVKVTRGIVSSSRDSDTLSADVMTDAKVNPGNSGGPIIDKHGNAMAIVTMKSLSSVTEDSYGIGISAGHIRTFLKKNDIALPTGDEAGNDLSAEDIATKVKPATLCILAVN